MGGAMVPLLARIYAIMPGSGVAAHVVQGEGPVATRTPDGSYHVAYVRTHDPEPDGGADERASSREIGVEVVYQESFSDPFQAGIEYQELVNYAPEPPELPDDPPGLAERRRAAKERDLIEKKLERQEADRAYLVEGYDDDRRRLGLGED
ncbi:MAG: hypothetical protein M3R38_35990 [Actinomycetota bacterium]|nr:hypothetical protein [Actinomycetota bacterium]